jgi:hypothetical protein
MTTRARQWRLAVALLGAGMAIMMLGGLLFPSSNLGGGLVLVGAPVAACGWVMLVVLVIVTVVDRITRHGGNADPARPE